MYAWNGSADVEPGRRDVDNLRRGEPASISQKVQNLAFNFQSRTAVSIRREPCHVSARESHRQAFVSRVKAYVLSSTLHILRRVADGFYESLQQDCGNFYVFRV